MGKVLVGLTLFNAVLIFLLMADIGAYSRSALELVSLALAVSVGLAVTMIEARHA
jgi:hypothetical protein